MRTQPLCRAAGRSDAAAVRSLLGSRCSVDARDGHQRTPLMWAAKGGSAECVELLLERRAVPDSADGRGWTALQYATSLGHIAVVELLCDQGCRPQASTALFHAASPDVAHRLLRARGDPQHRNGLGCTALFEAARGGRPDVAAAILEARADPRAEDASCRSPLFWAAASGDPRGIRLLLDGRACINSPDVQGTSPLDFAVRLGLSEAAAVLRDRGAEAQGDKASSVQRQDLAEVATSLAALHLALCEAAGHPERSLHLCRQLVDTYGMSADEAAEDPLTLRSPLHIAASCGNVACAEYLIQWRCDPGSKDLFGRTALCAAGMAGHITCCEALLRHGCKLSCRDCAGASPSQLAEQSGQLGTAAFLRGREAIRRRCAKRVRSPEPMVADPTFACAGSGYDAASVSSGGRAESNGEVEAPASPPPQHQHRGRWADRSPAQPPNDAGEARPQEIPAVSTPLDDEAGQEGEQRFLYTIVLHSPVHGQPLDPGSAEYMEALRRIGVVAPSLLLHRRGL